MSLYRTGAGAPIDVADQMGFPAGGFVSLWDGPSSNSAVGAIDLAYLFPFNVDEDLPIALLFGRVVGTAGVASTMKTAIWPNRRGRPVGVPVLGSNAPIATTVIGVPQSNPINQVLRRGRYWALTVHRHTAGSLPTMDCIASNQATIAYRTGAQTGLAVPGSASGHISGFTTPLNHDLDIMAVDLTAAVLTQLTAAAVPIIGAQLI